MAVQPEDQDNVIHYFTDEFENHMDTTISEFEPGTPESPWRDFFKYVDRIGMETPENTPEHKDMKLELASKDETPMENEEFEMEEPSEERKEDGYMADDEAGPIRARVPNWFYADMDFEAVEDVVSGLLDWVEPSPNLLSEAFKQMLVEPPKDQQSSVEMKKDDMETN